MTYFIAEIGFNFEGDMETAKKMIEAAAKAGAQAVKFQTFRASDIALPSSQHYEGIKCGEMDLDQHLEFYNVALDCDVEFISTPFSPWAVELLEKVGVNAYKVASMDCTNKYLLKYIKQTGKPVFLSTGMATLQEIFDTLNYLKEGNSGPVTLLHCISMYPAEAKSLNLDIIPFLKEAFHMPVGYSDHYPGIAACLAAVMLGAEVIETHFTLDSSREGGDHFHSVKPDSLKRLISDTALYNIMRGDRIKIFNRPDRPYAKDYRRGLYSARARNVGDIVKANDFLFCRPTSELSPNDLERLGGKVLIKEISIYQAIKENYVDNEE